MSWPNEPQRNSACRWLRDAVTQEEDGQENKCQSFRQCASAAAKPAQLQADPSQITVAPRDQQIFCRADFSSRAGPEYMSNKVRDLVL